MLTDTAHDAAERAMSDDPSVDLEALTEDLWVDLNGQVDRNAIRRVLTEVVPTYREARITTFVPIFVRRDALEILRART